MALEMKYFVLKPRAKDQHDPYASAAQEAMYRYAVMIESEDRELADDLKFWAMAEKVRQSSLKKD